MEYVFYARSHCSTRLERCPFECVWLKWVFTVGEWLRSTGCANDKDCVGSWSVAARDCMRNVNEINWANSDDHFNSVWDRSLISFHVGFVFRERKSTSTTHTYTHTLTRRIPGIRCAKLKTLASANGFFVGPSFP